MQVAVPGVPKNDYRQAISCADRFQVLHGLGDGAAWHGDILASLLGVRRASAAVTDRRPSHKLERSNSSLAIFTCRRHAPADPGSRFDFA